MAEVDWDRVRAAARASGRGPAGWPDDVRPIALEGLSLLGIGSDYRLYWDGTPIKMDREIVLTWWQKVLGTAASIGAFAAGVAAILPYLGIKP